MIIEGYKYMTRPAIYRMPDYIRLAPAEEREVFNFNGIGYIRQFTAEVIGANNDSWKNTFFEFYVDNSPNLYFHFSSDDIINGLGYRNAGRRMLDTQVFYFSGNRRSKIAISFSGFDFFRNIKIKVANIGSNISRVNIAILYYVRYAV